MKKTELNLILCLVFYWISLVVICLMVLSGCEERERIESEIWSIDSRDGSIYRVLDNGIEQFVLCTDKSAESFKAIQKNDLDELIIKAARRCN